MLLLLLDLDFDDGLELAHELLCGDLTRLILLNLAEEGVQESSLGSTALTSDNLVSLEGARNLEN